MAHILSRKLYDLVNVSTSFEGLFKKSQLHTGSQLVPMQQTGSFWWLTNAWVGEYTQILCEAGEAPSVIMLKFNKQCIAKNV